MTTTEFSRTSSTAPASAAGSSVARFLWIFTVLGIIVVVVVIGFLIGIVRALESIDNGLFTASSSVTGATGNVEPLPNYIHTINAALTDIDTALKPIRGQVADATASLVSIRGTAQNIDASLKDTSASLVNTSGSLVTIHPTAAGGGAACGSPGTRSGDDGEATLDAEWATAAAPDATIAVASCANTRTTFGGLIALQNLVNSANPPSRASRWWSGSLRPMRGNVPSSNFGVPAARFASAPTMLLCCCQEAEAQ